MMCLQVSNRGACIKIATDFISVDALPETMKLRQVYRREGVADVLNIRAMIWHAWCSLTELELGIEAEAAASPSTSQVTNTRSAAKRAKRREKKSSEDRSNFVNLCPDPHCQGNSRTFDVNGLRNHL